VATRPCKRLDEEGDKYAGRRMTGKKTLSANLRGRSEILPESLFRLLEARTSSWGNQGPHRRHLGKKGEAEGPKRSREQFYFFARGAGIGVSFSHGVILVRQVSIESTAETDLKERRKLRKGILN